MTTTSRDSFAVTSAGLAEGTNANTVQRQSVCHYNIEGRTFSLPIADNLAFTAFPGTTFTPLAAGQISAFFFMANAAGTMHVIQAPPVTAPNRPGYMPNAFEWPARETHACIGAVVVQTNNSATFTPGSTDLGATDVVDTFVNVGMDYGRPIPY